MLLFSTRMAELPVAAMRRASAAPLDRLLPVMLTFCTPPLSWKSAGERVVAVEPLTVLLLKVELSRLRAKTARPLPVTRLLEKVMFDCEPAVVELRLRAVVTLPVKGLLSTRTLV